MSAHQKPPNFKAQYELDFNPQDDEIAVTCPAGWWRRYRWKWVWAVDTGILGYWDTVNRPRF